MRKYSKRYWPLQIKLLGYFLLFGAIILVVLWVFQSFLLKPYYTASKSNRVEQSASRISQSIEQNKNVWTTIDNVASNNSLSVYVYDSGAGLMNLLFQCTYDVPADELVMEEHDIYSYYRSAKNNGGSYMTVDTNSVADIAKRKLDMLRQAFSGATEDSASAEIHYRSQSEVSTESMVCANIITRDDGSERFLLITSSITPLSNTIEIMRGQLIWVTFVFVILSVIFSLYASHRIAKPISKTNNSAKELARSSPKRITRSISTPRATLR